MGEIVDALGTDPWKHIRAGMYRNAEPKVELIGMTQPTEAMRALGITSQTLPAYTARHCWESAGKYGTDPQVNEELDKGLTARLIKMGHTTPLQALTFTWDVSGTSKSLQAQWTRHKVGVGWCYKSTRFVESAGAGFVYNTYDYIKDESTVRQLLAIDEQTAKTAVESYGKKRALGATKQDARKVMPVEYDSHCAFFANARALRHLFDLRLAKKAEWEIRRMSAMLLENVMEVAPVVFQDIYDRTLTQLTGDRSPKA